MKLKGLPFSYGVGLLIGIGLGAMWGFKNYLQFLYWGEAETFRWQRFFWVPIVNNGTWGLLLPIVHYFISNFQIKIDSKFSQILKVLGVSLLMALIHEGVSNLIYFIPMHFLGYRTLTWELVGRIIKAFPFAMVDRFIEYWVLYVVYTAFDSQQKLQDKQLEIAQLENQFSSARLNALRFQLHPHFLFNTLNTISSLMEISIKDAQKMVSKLGNLLRTALDRNKDNQIVLREEIEFIQSYLDIEQIRFQDRLEVHYHIDEEVLDALVPHLILQPLVENAIKHGFAKSIKSGNITVCIRKQEETIKIEVMDDGDGTQRQTADLLELGIGLKNVKERLRLIYGENYEFDIESKPKEGFKVNIAIPFLKRQS